MANFNFEFDLETAALELERVNDLLCVYQEFFESECPPEGAKGKEADFAARYFADRSYQFQSVIYAVQDKIIEIHKKMETAIDAYFASAKKNGGDVA